jgi:glycosyltransferase involved in cell wall biosynthesis
LKPLVSILIPAYNAAQWVHETLSSATNQTWPHKEVIVIDDGSSDRTLEIAGLFQSATVKVVTQPNAGACAARNRAFSMAQGDYIQWLDADDVLHPEKIARQMAIAEECGDPLALLTAAWGKFFFRLEKAAFVSDALWRDLAPVDWILTKLGQSCWMNPACWLVSRRLTELAGLWDVRLATSGDDDGEYICRIVSASTEVRFVTEARAYYRIGTVGSLSWNLEWNEKSLRSLCLAYRLQVDHLLALEDSTRTRAACLRFLHTLVPYFYGIDDSFLGELREVARTLGGELPPPRASWKNYPLEKLFGARITRKILNNLWTTKWLAQRNLDKYLHDRAISRPSSSGNTATAQSRLNLGGGRENPSADAGRRATSSDNGRLSRLRPSGAARNEMTNDAGIDGEN